MNSTLLILSREYATRVRKKSFILLTVLVPVLMAVLVALPALLVFHSEANRHATVVVDDETGMFVNAFADDKNTTYLYRNGDIESLKREAVDGRVSAVCHILSCTQSLNANLYYKGSLPPALAAGIERQMNGIFFDRVLQDTFRINPVDFGRIQDLTKAHVAAIRIDDEGNERVNVAAVNQLTGMAAGLVIYFVIVLFASQVLRGVLEEKSSRIVEILVSSVRPGQLLAGKITGIALVGLTQLLVWLLLTSGLVLLFHLSAPAVMSPSGAAGADMDLLRAVGGYFPMPFGRLIVCFLFYFITGYLTYAALFAATGSMADNESDSQQYTLPVTLPLILALVLVPAIANDPDGQLAFWASIIPFTSPICMMTRLPAGVPPWQLLTSMTLTAAFVAVSIRAAAKVYRTGILTYGKNNGWKGIFRRMRQ